MLRDICKRFSGRVLDFRQPKNPQPNRNVRCRVRILIILIFQTFLVQTRRDFFRTAGRVRGGAPSTPFFEPGRAAERVTPKRPLAALKRTERVRTPLRSRRARNKSTSSPSFSPRESVDYRPRESAVSLVSGFYSCSPLLRRRRHGRFSTNTISRARRTELRVRSFHSDNGFCFTYNEHEIRIDSWLFHDFAFRSIRTDQE